jgi:hypothetical protein
MGEISDLILSYRECARHVWNCHFRELPDGWHEFADVESALLHGIVLAQSDEAKDWNQEWSESGCYPSLRVVPTLGPKGLPALWCQPPRGNTWNWQEMQLKDPSIRLAFIGFFDWRTDGYRDYQYIRCRVNESPAHPQVVGSDLLLDPLSVEVFHERISRK